MGGLLNMFLGGLGGQASGLSPFLMNNAQQGHLGLLSQYLGNMMPKQQSSQQFNNQIDPMGLLRRMGYISQ